MRPRAPSSLRWEGTRREWRAVRGRRGSEVKATRPTTSWRRVAWSHRSTTRTRSSEPSSMRAATQRHVDGGRERSHDVKSPPAGPSMPLVRDCSRWFSDLTSIALKPVSLTTLRNSTSVDGWTAHGARADTPTTVASSTRAGPSAPTDQDAADALWTGIVKPGTSEGVIIATPEHPSRTRVRSPPKMRPRVRWRSSTGRATSIAWTALTPAMNRSSISDQRFG